MTLQEKHWSVANHMQFQNLNRKMYPRIVVIPPITKVNERIYIDLYKLKAHVGMNKNISKSNWRLMVDEDTQMKFTHFFETKKGMVEPTCT